MPTNQSNVVVYDAGSLTGETKVVKYDAYIRAMQDLIDTYDKLIAQKDDAYTRATQDPGDTYYKLIARKDDAYIQVKKRMTVVIDGVQYVPVRRLG